MADNNNIEKMLRAAVERKNQERMAQERASIVQTIGRDIVGALTPVLKAIAERPLPISEIAAAIREGVAQGMRGWNKSDPVINIPPIKFPEQKAPIVNVQPPKVEVTVPAIKIPEIKIPDLNNIMGALRITGWDKSLMDHPIPVQLRDADGKPVFLGGGGSSPIFAPSGGGTNFPREVMDLTGTNPALRVTGSFSISASNASTQLIDSSLNAVGTAANPLNVALVSGSASSTVAQIGNTDGDFSASNPLNVTLPASAFVNIEVSDSQQSGITSHVSGDFKGLDVYVLGSGETTIANLLSGDDRVKTDGSAVTQPISVTDIFATSATSNVVTPDNRVKVDGSGVTQPISVTDIFSTTSTSNVVTPDNRVKVDGSGVTQPVSGTVAVSGITNSVAASIVDSTGVGYSGSNPVPVNLVSQSLASSASTIVDSTGVGYSGSNPVPVNLVSQSLASSASTLVDSSGVGYSGSNPIPITIVTGAAASANAVLTRQTNPSAVAADYVPLSADDLGRQLVRPLQVRDLMKTAYVSVTNGTEATLLAGVAGAFLDCIMIVGSNNSDFAVSVDIRAVTAGNVVHTMRIPANGSVGWAPAVPWPQDATGNNWTIDGPDETGRTLTFSGLFVQEV